MPKHPVFSDLNSKVLGCSKLQMDMVIPCDPNQATDTSWREVGSRVTAVT